MATEYPKNNNTELWVAITRIEEKLDAILEQTKKTNGRVSELEDEVERLNNYRIEHPVEKIEEDINNIIKETETIRFFSKRPKLIILLVIGTIVLFSLSDILDVLKFLTGN